MMDDNTDLRLRGSTTIDLPGGSNGTIHPFSVQEKSFPRRLSKEIALLLVDDQAKKIAGFFLLNLMTTLLLLVWCGTTNSMGLTAYTYLTIFDTFRILTSLTSVWVSKQRSSPVYSFGYERFEVLAVFTSTMLAILGSFFIAKESIERMIIQPEIHVGRLLVGTGVAFIMHLTTTYTVNNKAFNHVTAASSSSWLQEHVSDISESVCHVLPGLSKLLLPRINPFALIAAAGGIALVITYILIDINNYYSVDTWVAIWIALMTIGTMLPMSVYSGKILLQTTPSYIIGQLDKSLREASTLDGVLEFRNEHFWTLSFGTMAGSLQVRVRRDADEQMVLAHVYQRISNLISILTIQIFKDDWSHPSSYQILGGTSFLNNLNTTSLPTTLVANPHPSDKPKVLPNSQAFNFHVTNSAQKYHPVGVGSLLDGNISRSMKATGSMNIPGIVNTNNSLSQTAAVPSSGLSNTWGHGHVPLQVGLERTNSMKSSTSGVPTASDISLK